MNFGTLSVADAQMLWLRKYRNNDQFLLYCFAGEVVPTVDKLREVLQKNIGDNSQLKVSLVDDPTGWQFPHWETNSHEFDELIIFHSSQSFQWPDVLTTIIELRASAVPVEKTAWLLHIFPDVRNVPEVGSDENADSPKTIVVLQISHALVDGRGAAQIARAILSGEILDCSVTLPARTKWPRLRYPIALGSLFIAGMKEVHAKNVLAKATSGGELSAPPKKFPVYSINTHRNIAEEIFCLSFKSAELKTSTISVTVFILTAISVALPKYLAAVGEVPKRLGAEVPVGGDHGIFQSVSGNNYRSIGIDLRLDIADLASRAEAISLGLKNGRRRIFHRLFENTLIVQQQLPAKILRTTIANQDFTQIPPEMSGNTVVSSVFRGPANWKFAGMPVQFTAGFPALSSSMQLTHGVNGLGERITISVCSNGPAESYQRALSQAIAEVQQALIVT